MNKKLLGTAVVALPLLAVGGWVVANAQKPSQKDGEQPSVAGYICPATGEELPCPLCCPLNKE